MELGKKTIQISFDIEDERPHKALRIYDPNGNALGFGQMVVKKADQESNLFETKPGYITYAATIDLDLLVKKEKEVENRKVKTITKAEEPDVEDTDDSEEDNWVRGSLKQMKDAKVTITLTTTAHLREEYRAMKHNLKKSSDNSLAEIHKDMGELKEMIKDEGGTVDGIKYPPPRGNVEKEDTRPKVIIGDDMEETCIACEGGGVSTSGKTCVPCKGTGYLRATIEKKDKDAIQALFNMETEETEPDEETREVKNEILEDSVTLTAEEAEQYKQAELPEPIKEAIREGSAATCYGDMPQEYIGDAAKEADWEEQKALERQELIERKQEEIQTGMRKAIEKKAEFQNKPISLDDL